ncbi:MAG: DNA polymerase III subunit gamma/tau [Candidatus Paceibacterota bacterium]
MAWQRKHRPKLVSQLHLTNIRQSLQQMMEQGKFPQVLLFAGPKGTGKTSASRIIGNLLNDPKNAELVDEVFFNKSGTKQKKFQEPDINSEFARRIYAGNSFVVQEMDAASYRGIDDVRALKERVMLPPQEGKMAVYILDEAHMFTNEAFNALLKLLEEPPAHAVFILATTELHKIPATIASRSTKLDFRKATIEEMVAALEFVIKEEKLKSEPAALIEIAKRADGSFRDAVKLLELVAQSGDVSGETVSSTLGHSAQQTIDQLLEAVLQKDASAVSAIIHTLREQNVQETYFYKVLFSTLHQAIIQESSIGKSVVRLSAKIARFLLQELLKTNLQQYSPIAFLPLELSLLDLIERSQQKSGPTAKKKNRKS